MSRLGSEVLREMTVGIWRQRIFRKMQRRLGDKASPVVDASCPGHALGGGGSHGVTDRQAHPAVGQEDDPSSSGVGPGDRT